MKLEKKMMLEVEGGTKEWCMKLLRHETGHAINYAYKLYDKKKWQTIFGSFETEYKDNYRFRPYSKNYVRHIENFYAQYHPDEDFAETFAVWLTPEIDWKKEYEGWNAIGKLKFVDELMTDIIGKPPIVAKGKAYWDVSKMKQTLGMHYKKRQQFYAEDFPDFHDHNLKKIFAVRDDQNTNAPLASQMLRKYRSEILKSLKQWTGENKYIASMLLNRIIERCRDLTLVCVDAEPVVALKISIYFSSLLMNYVYTGRFRGKKL